MPMSQLTLVYRQVIDASTEGTFAKHVHQLSYDEFKMKSQAYNPDRKFTTFTALKANDGRANSLHYKCSFPVAGLVEGLKWEIPNLKDSLGKPLSFGSWQFEVIESDIDDPSKHSVAISYITPLYNLFEIIGTQLLLSKNLEQTEHDGISTFMISIQPGLSIASYKELIPAESF